MENVELLDFVIKNKLKYWVNHNYQQHNNFHQMIHIAN